MVARINKNIFAETRAVRYFKGVADHYEKRVKGPAPKDKDFSKLLTSALDTFEREHGFVVVGDKLPNYAGLYLVMFLKNR